MRLNISGYEAFWGLFCFLKTIIEVHCPMSLVLQPVPFREPVMPGTGNTGMHCPDETYLCSDTYTIKKDQLT